MLPEKIWGLIRGLRKAVDFAFSIGGKRVSSFDTDLS